MNQKTFQRLYAAGQRNFRHADLRGLSLQHLDLAGADFTGAKIQGTNFRGANLTGAKFCLAKAGLRPRYVIFAMLSSVLSGAIASGVSVLLFMGLFVPGLRELVMPSLIGLVLFGYLRLPQRAIRILNTEGHGLGRTDAPSQTLALDALIVLIVYVLLTYVSLASTYPTLPQNMLREGLLLFSFAAMHLHLYLIPLLLFAHLLNRSSVQTAIAIYGEKQGLCLGILPAYSLGAAAVIGGMTFVYDAVAPRHLIPTTWIAYGCAIAVIGGSCWLMLLIALSQVRHSLHRPITHLSHSPIIIPWLYWGTTSFQQANLTGAQFTGACLVGTRFNRANLTHVHWGNAKGTTFACGLWPVASFHAPQF